MSFRPLPTRRQALLACLTAAITALACAGLCSAAALVPAPATLLPFVAALCITLPVLAAWELPVAIAVLRAGRVPEDQPEPLDASALTALRRHLDRLPETQHPLGL
jgi:hypothetical protein